MRRNGLMVAGAVALLSFVCAGSVVLAQEAKVPVLKTPAPVVHGHATSAGWTITLIKQGKTIATLVLEKDPSTQISFDSENMVRNSDTRTTTLKGNVAIRLTHEGQKVMTLTADEATIKVTDPDL